MKIKRWVVLLTIGPVLAFAADAHSQQSSSTSPTPRKLEEAKAKLHQTRGMLAYNKIIREAALEAYATLKASEAKLAAEVKALNKKVKQQEAKKADAQKSPSGITKEGSPAAPSPPTPDPPNTSSGQDK